MIDRRARDELGAALRGLASGRLSNDGFEDRLSRAVWSSRDPGVRAVRWAAWTLYDDLHEHRLVGPRALGRHGRRPVARWVLFLKSNDEYQWPELAGWLRLLLLVPNLVTFNLIGRGLARWRDRRGDADVWPFLRRTDLARAMASWPGAATDRGGAP